MFSAAQASQYPPEAAMSSTNAVTGTFLSEALPDRNDNQ